MVTDGQWLRECEFTDESIFTFELGSQGHTGNWYFSSADARSNKFIHTTKHPKHIMIFASVRAGYKPILRLKII